MNQYKLIIKEFTSVSSTQEMIDQYHNEINPNTWVACVAHEQTHGRGTHQRVWMSPPHVNLYVTYGCLFPLKKSTYLHFIPHVAAFAVANTLQSLNINNKISIKWVNDVLVDNKKISGVLVESIPSVHPEYLTIHLGVGININLQKANCDSLDQPITSLLASTGQEYDKTMIFHLLTQHIQKNMMLLIKEGLKPFHVIAQTLLEKFQDETIYFDTEDQHFAPRMFKADIIGIDSELRLVVKPKECVQQLFSPHPIHYSTENTIAFFRGRIVRSLFSSPFSCIPSSSG